jgi:CRISPR-associated protein Cas6
MLWQEDDVKPSYVVPDDVVDVSFQIDCKHIALDHAHDLSQALLAHLPWLTAEKEAGVHLIHGASTGNGWIRPGETDSVDFIYLSRRSRMQLRLPRTRLADVEVLSGKTLDVGGHAVRVGGYQIKPLTVLGTLFSRYVLVEPGEDEDQFMLRIAAELSGLGITVKKMLCGIGHSFTTPQGAVQTLSIMVADLDPEAAVILQKRGVGRGREMGMGLFLPHKSIKPVGDMADKTHFNGSK